MTALTIEQWKRWFEERKGCNSRPFEESMQETFDHVSDKMGTVIIGGNGEVKGWLNVAPRCLRNQEREES